MTFEEWFYNTWVSNSKAGFETPVGTVSLYGTDEDKLKMLELAYEAGYASGHNDCEDKYAK